MRIVGILVGCRATSLSTASAFVDADDRLPLLF
jgi:hypothetical protein